MRAHTAATSAATFLPPRPTEPAIRSSLQAGPGRGQAEHDRGVVDELADPSDTVAISPGPPGAAGAADADSENAPTGTSGSTSCRAIALSMSAWSWCSG